MPGALAADVVLLVTGIGVLYFGADWLVSGAGRLATSFGVRPIVVGLTVVSLGTSAPELVVCLVAALGGRPGIVTGNILGSNLANMGLILGLTALITPLAVPVRVVRRDLPLMIGATLLLYPLAADLRFGRLDALVLLAMLGSYLYASLRSVERSASGAAEALGRESRTSSPETRPAPSRLRDATLMTVGCGGLVLGGYLIVEGAVDIGLALGVPEVVIGLTVVAVGTSLPELATSVVAALRGQVDIAVGNVIGSNIFNLTGILGLTALASPIPVEASVLSRELLAVTIMSVLLFPLVRLDWRLQRREGGLLLVAYAAALGLLL